MITPGEKRFLETLVAFAAVLAFIVGGGLLLASPVGPVAVGVVLPVSLAAFPLWLARRHSRPSSRPRRASAEAARVRHEDEAMAIANGGSS